MKYARIEELRQQDPVAAMCPVLEVSERSYHAWRQRSSSLRMQENLRLETEIKAAHQADSHETRAALQAEAAIQGDDGFEPCTAAGAQSSGSAIRHGGAQSCLDERYHLPYRRQGSVQR